MNRGYETTSPETFCTSIRAKGSRIWINDRWQRQICRADPLVRYTYICRVSWMRKCEATLFDHSHSVSWQECIGNDGSPLPIPLTYSEYPPKVDCERCGFIRGNEERGHCFRCLCLVCLSFSFDVDDALRDVTIVLQHVQFEFLSDSRGDWRRATDREREWKVNSEDVNMRGKSVSGE